MPYNRSGPPKTSVVGSDLQSAIQAHHIMVPRQQFIAGKDANHARAMLDDQQNDEYDLIPFPKRGDPSGYVLRSDRQKYDVDRGHLISDSTPVITLIQYFTEERHVLFVLTGNTISGLVHLSDLNSTLCKVAFFMLVNNVERACIDLFRSNLPESLLKRTLSARNLSGLLGRIKKWRENDALPFDAAALQFSEALQLARVEGRITLTVEEIEDLNRVRNHTAHAGRALYSGIPDLQVLKNSVSTSIRVLRELSSR